MYFHRNIEGGDLIRMRDGTDEIIKTQLYGEIETLEKGYHSIKEYLSGTEAESLKIIGDLQGFRNTLSKISMHILTFLRCILWKGKKPKSLGIHFSRTLTTPWKG